MKNRSKRTVPVCIALAGGKAATLRVLLPGLTFAIFFVAVAPRPGPAQEAVWSVFKQKFMTSESRVVESVSLGLLSNCACLEWRRNRP